MIESGELRDVIEIQEFTTSTDENGFEIQDYKTMYTLRAKVKTQGTKEFMSTVICRVRKGIDSDKYLFYNSKRWNIRHVHLMEDRQFMTLTCEVSE